MATVSMEPQQEMTVYYVGKPQSEAEALEQHPSHQAIEPTVRAYTGTTTRPYEVSSRVFSTARTAIVITVLLTCIAGVFFLLYSIDDHWKPDWKTEAYCDFESLIKNHCSSESIERVSAIIQRDADRSFRNFNGDTNFTSLRLASEYFDRCRQLYDESNSTFNNILAESFARNLTVVDVIRLLSNHSPLYSVNVWQTVPCENSTCTLFKCDPTTARLSLLSASSFLQRVAALNGSIVDDHRRAMREVYPALIESLLAACTHSNDTSYELFEDNPKYAIASASFKALEPFSVFRRVDLKWFVADMLIGIVRPRSIELAQKYFSNVPNGGEIECLDSTKRIFGHITFIPYIEQQSERFVEVMEQVPFGKQLVKIFGHYNNVSRMILGLSDDRLAEIEAYDIESLRPFTPNVTFADFTLYERQLDGIYHGNRRLRAAIVKKAYTQDNKLVVPLIIDKLLDVADTPVKDNLAQLLLRNADHDLELPEEQWMQPDVAL